MSRKSGLNRHAAPPQGLLCNYPHRQCLAERLDGYEYCWRHILEDKSAPYRQCNYVSSKTNRRCPYGAPRTDKKDGFCWQHSRQGRGVGRWAKGAARGGVKRCAPPETAGELLEELGGRYAPRPGAPPVKRTDADGRLTAKAFECSSSDESEAEMTSQGGGEAGGVARSADSGDESPDSEIDDPLKYAGTYTADEAAVTTREKLIRLQSLYIDQFRRLQHVLKEKRRDYLADTGDPGGSQEKGERESAQVLRALKRYHKRHGIESLVHEQSRARSQAMSEGKTYPGPPARRCSWPGEGGPCNRPALPATQYCTLHVLQEARQTLFVACERPGCARPVVRDASPPVCDTHRALGPPAPRVVPRIDPSHLLSKKERSSQQLSSPSASQATPPAVASNITLATSARTPST